MTEGIYEWQMKIDEVIGTYFCVGILPAEPDWDVKFDNWAKAFCICSNQKPYGMIKIKGEIILVPNDIIHFILDLNENTFIIKGVGEKFVCELRGLTHQSYIPFVSYPPLDRSKLTFI